MGKAYTTPKQFIPIWGKPILIHTLLKFQNHPEIDRIYLSVLKKYIPITQKLCNMHKITKISSITEVVRVPKKQSIKRYWWQESIAMKKI